MNNNTDNSFITELQLHNFMYKFRNHVGADVGQYLIQKKECDVA
jgi:hypothetical protein